MLEVPTFVFYVGTVAMVVVCGFLAVFLFYLIKAARIALALASFLEEEGRKISSKIHRWRRAFGVFMEFLQD